MSSTNNTHRKMSDEDQAAIDAFFAKGGKVTRCKTREMSHDLGISNNTWGNKLTRDEKKSKDAPVVGVSLT